MKLSRYSLIAIPWLLAAVAACLAQQLPATIRQLTSPEMEGRAFRGAGGRLAAESIARHFRENGLQVSPQQLPGGGQNVLGLLPGVDDRLRHEYLIVGAHYDGLGGSFVGAMENAAGVALLIELARELGKKPLPRGVLFIAFDGGEERNAGARYYLEHPAVPLEKTNLAMMLSGFGGGWSEQLRETLYAIGAEFVPSVQSALRRNGIHQFGRDVGRWPGSEHLLFNFPRLPTIGLTNGLHYAYHSKADTPNRIDYAALDIQLNRLVKLVREVGGMEGKIELVSQPAYDSGEAMAWHTALSALRENLLKSPENQAGQTQIDDVLRELRRLRDRPVPEPKAREAVLLRAANLCHYIAHPNAVEYEVLTLEARKAEAASDKPLLVESLRRLLRFLEDEYRPDEQTLRDLRERLAKLTGK